MTLEQAKGLRRGQQVVWRRETDQNKEIRRLTNQPETAFYPNVLRDMHGNDLIVEGYVSSSHAISPVEESWTEVDMNGWPIVQIKIANNRLLKFSTRWLDLPAPQ